ncbi:uncharacterized protein LOC133323262 [Musca vetustissima]|uniref:uncharacterized protein LOC133323262 n=1 Tax=Musca vetustissima TaxID=27455 RepID=UPI002AB5E75A|nr:uncharacterized protein LOC133323262 [Musca vetustissima]
MQLTKKSTELILAATFCLLTVTPTGAYPSSCFECEEEVWEEVPCDEIPTNSTTTYPTTPYVTTSTPKTETTTTSTTTTTTPYPATTTASDTDPYKKCYCECKTGCKEFCRKVIHNPQSKSQIIQITEVSKPLPQGRIESTYYHSRKLVPAVPYPHPHPPPSYEHPEVYEAPPSVRAQKPLAEVYNSVPYYSSSVSEPHNYGRDLSNAYNDNKYLPNLSYRNKHETYYYSSPETDLSDLPSHFQKLYSQAIQDLENENYKPNSIPKLPDYNSHPCQEAGKFSSPVPVDSVRYSDKYYDSLYSNSDTYAYYDDFGTIAENPHHSLLYK